MNKILVFGLMSFCLLQPLAAQEYNKVEGVWNATFIDLPLNDKLSLRSEFHFRTVDYFNVWNQQIFRPQLTYTDSKNIKWTAGYTYLRNFDSDINADPRVRNEHNIWEQVVYTIPLKKSSLSTWIRLEHRFQEELPLQTNRSLRSFDFSSRIRFRFTYERTLSKPEAKVPVNFIFYDEVFTIMSPGGTPFKFNQNWTFFGLGIKLTDKMRINTGFQKNTIFKSTDNYLKNRLWNTILFYKI
ncbi:MAG: hypothetical protein CBC08_01715 [Flavobacteriaceae bacterium TMED48]|nr:MAG: hypothetical protein CBC08_01715 [Flavobacteriaceae bacterium TMED48]|tara:strand:+ start:8011 stop:8733 length:723 start_codon:yes stop_codon:yes gene_type:complete